MSVQTLYIPHTAGTVLGSHYRSPWVAASAAQAAATQWDGQPVFTDRVEAFAWIDLARSDTFRMLDFAVARADADTDSYPTGARRVHVDHQALADPHRQVVRADTGSPGPHVSVLNALYRSVHEQALHEWWLHSQPGNGSDPAAEVAHTVWQRTYPIAFQDAAQVLTGRIGHAAHLLLTDPDPRHGLDDATIAGLSALAHTAASTASTDPHTPGPPADVIDDTLAATQADPDQGWRHAVDRVWAHALITAAGDGLTSAATALTSAWTSPGTANTISRQAFGDWLRRAVADTRQTILDEWRQVGGLRPIAPAPAAARAYPAVTTIHPPSTADNTSGLPAVAVAAAALPAGRNR